MMKYPIIKLTILKLEFFRKIAYSEIDTMNFYYAKVFKILQNLSKFEMSHSFMLKIADFPAIIKSNLFKIIKSQISDLIFELFAKEIDLEFDMMMDNVSINDYSTCISYKFKDIECCHEICVYRLLYLEEKLLFYFHLFLKHEKDNNLNSDDLVNQFNFFISNLFKISVSSDLELLEGDNIKKEILNELNSVQFSQHNLTDNSLKPTFIIQKQTSDNFIPAANCHEGRNNYKELKSKQYFNIIDTNPIKTKNSAGNKIIIDNDEIKDTLKDEMQDRKTSRKRTNPRKPNSQLNQETSQTKKMSSKELNDSNETTEEYPVNSNKSSTKNKLDQINSFINNDLPVKYHSFLFTKRENIDKNIIRRFRKFLKLRCYSKLEYINPFFKDFVDKNLLPPFTYGNVKFNSFNTKYMIWLFEHENVEELYKLFIDEMSDSIELYYKKKFNLETENLNILNEYIKKLDKIFIAEGEKKSTKAYPGNHNEPRFNLYFSNNDGTYLDNYPTTNWIFNTPMDNIQ